MHRSSGGGQQQQPPLIPDGAETSSSATDTPPKKKSWVRKITNPTVKLPAISQVTWGMLWKSSKEFLSDPVNAALLVWMILSVPACIIIMGVKFGLFDRILTAQQRESAEEIATQVVNALYTLTCLIVLPLLCRHTFLLIRWSPSDKVELRKAFCKNGKRKPHDWTHISIVVFWGQITCWATIAFAAIYWVFPLGDRPAWLISITFSVSMAAPVISFLYLLLSPLSKDYDIVKEGDEEMLRMYQRKNAFFSLQREVHDAKWNGTVFPGCCIDRRIACLTCIFPCCMFGYNMERLGFGHKVVHSLAFIIVLFGPVLVFEFSAESLRNLGLTEKIIYYSGVMLAVLSLAYGGCWRIKMRENYGLPGSYICCGSKRCTDICVWMWCSCCALCQELRTTDQYQVEEAECDYEQANDGGGYPDGHAEMVPPEGNEDVIELSSTAVNPPPLQTMEPEPKGSMH